MYEMHPSDAPKTTVFVDACRRARKDHKCDTCKKPIEKKSFYQYFAGIIDGDFRSVKICEKCYLG